MYNNMKLLSSLAAICVFTIVVNGQGTFVPSKTVPKVLTPGAAVDLDDDRNLFVKVSQKGNITKWTQTVEGIPVYGSVLTTHGDEKGMIESVQGFVSHTASLVDTKPLIDSQRALDIVKAHWKHDINECMLEFRIDAQQLQILESGTGWDHLIWYIEYYVEMADFDIPIDDIVGPVPSLVIGMVNAHTSRIEDTWDDLARAEIKAVAGNTKVGKTILNLEVEKNGEVCKHKDSSRRVEVFDIFNQKKTSYKPTTSEFVCDEAADEEWDRLKKTSAYSPRNEVYDHATKFVDMWEELMGDTDDIYNTSTSFLNFYVHYGDNHPNAFFDGKAFKFGDGSAEYYPHISLDIVCHEIGHAVTKWQSGSKLQYTNTQQGGINEAYSDIVGETCDIHYHKKTDALIGKEVMKRDTDKAIRSMCDPTSIGDSVDHLSKYYNKMDMHYSSGIYNKAWCLLKNTDDWDYVMAFKVFTDANLRYWNPRSSMHCGACGVETAAAERGYKRDDVTAAFKVVGVSCGSCKA